MVAWWWLLVVGLGAWLLGMATLGLLLGLKLRERRR